MLCGKWQIKCRFLNIYKISFIRLNAKIIYMFKEVLALNKLHWLIWHKTQQNPTLYIKY